MWEPGKVVCTYPPYRLATVIDGRHLDVDDTFYDYSNNDYTVPELMSFLRIRVRWFGDTQDSLPMLRCLKEASNVDSS